MRRILSVAVVTALMAVGCGNPSDELDLSEDKKQIIQADANGLDVCEAMGFAPGCDLCLELGYYGDGICDIAMILHGLCEGPDPDCASAEIDCGNGVDDDMDGLVDCGDSDCAFTPACMATCGDGIVNPGEECDDGNAVNGDGCSNICLLENITPTEVCSNLIDDDQDGLVDCDDPDCVNAAACGATCGNGVVEAGEECDDGNGTPGDGCAADCTLETVTPETNCTDRVDNDGDGLVDCADPDCANVAFCMCGNGVVDPGEACDDGNNTDGDGCSSSCQVEASSETQCDDGIDNDGDGLVDCADSDCQNDPVCGVCGNGIVEAGEQCDDGNVTIGDGCDDRCMLEVSPEICNDGIDNDLDGLVDCADTDCASDPACGSPMCGNGIVEAGEECDDGNSVNGDGCSSTCLIE